MRLRLGCWLILLAACLPGWSVAHEMGTSALHLQELSDGHGLLRFKRSQSADGQLPPITFTFSTPCRLEAAVTTSAEEGEVTQQARFDCPVPLRAQRIRASGFTRLAPDLILHVRHRDGRLSTHLLVPSRPEAGLGEPTTAAPEGGFVDYLEIGLEHILFGWDHVLFITGVFLLWRRSRSSPGRLLGQFTLFTLGHSVTLALVVLGWIAVPTRLIEAWIALSVLWLACQLALPDDHPQPTPGLLLVAFGLLHGSGFALSMQDRGFPEERLISTLIAFNLGIELGQLLIVLALGLLLLRRRPQPADTLATQLLTVVMGGAALFWTLQRMTAYVHA